MKKELAIEEIKLEEAKTEYREKKYPQRISRKYFKIRIKS